MGIMSTHVYNFFMLLIMFFFSSAAHANNGGTPEGGCTEECSTAEGEHYAQEAGGCTGAWGGYLKVCLYLIIMARSQMHTHMYIFVFNLRIFHCALALASPPPLSPMLWANLLLWWLLPFYLSLLYSSSRGLYDHKIVKLRVHVC